MEIVMAERILELDVMTLTIILDRFKMTEPDSYNILKEIIEDNS